MIAGHRQIDHTADLALELWAPTEAELLLEGARAIVALLAPDSGTEADATRDIRIDSVDREDRLVQWLNEILVAAVMDGFLFRNATISLREGGLDAAVSGLANAGDRIVTELKSVTYHDLSICHEDGEWRATVVIDV